MDSCLLEAPLTVLQTSNSQATASLQTATSWLLSGTMQTPEEEVGRYLMRSTRLDTISMKSMSSCRERGHLISWERGWLSCIMIQFIPSLESLIQRYVMG